MPSSRGPRRPQDPLLLPLLRPVVEVLRELLVEGQLDLLAVGAELLQDLVNLVGKELRWQRILLATDRRLDAAEEAFRAAEGEKGCAGGDARRLDGFALDLRGDVDGRSPCGLEPIELGVEVRPGSNTVLPAGTSFGVLLVSESRFRENCHRYHPCAKHSV